MALKVVWSPQAIESYDEVITYLKNNWSEKEIKKFVRKSNAVIELICINPKMYKLSSKNKHLHKAFLFKPLSLVYRYKPRKQEIELVTFWNNKRELRKL